MKRSIRVLRLSPQRQASPRPYPVLAPLSRGYSERRGTFFMSYAPFRRCTPGIATRFSLDLHVLGTPPTFVLSQDQTLQSNLLSKTWRRRLTLLIQLTFPRIEAPNCCSVHRLKPSTREPGEGFAHRVSSLTIRRPVVDGTSEVEWLNISLALPDFQRSVARRDVPQDSSRGQRRGGDYGDEVRESQALSGGTFKNPLRRRVRRPT
jgi:hypothetical protein